MFIFLLSLTLSHEQPTECEYQQENDEDDYDPPELFLFLALVASVNLLDDDAAETVHDYEVKRPGHIRILAHIHNVHLVFAAINSSLVLIFDHFWVLNLY